MSTSICQRVCLLLPDGFFNQDYATTVSAMSVFTMNVKVAVGREYLGQSHWSPQIPHGESSMCRGADGGFGFSCILDDLSIRINDRYFR